MARAADFDLARALARPGFTPAQRDAPALATTVKQQGQSLVTMGMLSALDSSAAGDALTIHAEANKKALDGMLAMAKMLAGQSTTGSTMVQPPTQPPPTP